MNHPQRIKVSYSILNAWAQGKHEDAIRYFFKLETVTSPAMLAGRDWHKKWEDEIGRTKKLPELFGGKPLVNPSPEQYIRVDVNEWLTLSGKIDCYDKPTIYEFKTGRQTSEDIVRSKQVGVYGVLATLNKQYVERAEIYCYNQHLQTDALSMSIVHITDKVLQDSLNWVETLASEMKEYIEKNDLYSKYGK